MRRASIAAAPAPRPRKPSAPPPRCFRSTTRSAWPTPPPSRGSRMRATPCGRICCAGCGSGTRPATSRPAASSGACPASSPRGWRRSPRRRRFPTATPPAAVTPGTQPPPCRRHCRTRRCPPRARTRLHRRPRWKPPASQPPSRPTRCSMLTAPGRFILAAHSPSGAGLQLVDMLTGPSETAGAAGAQDGRLDRLLDVGTYKLRVFSAKAATGTVSLTVTPFHDAAPPAALPRPGHPLSTTLKDGEQRAFWLLVPPGQRPERPDRGGRPRTRRPAAVARWSGPDGAGAGAAAGGARPWPSAGRPADHRPGRTRRLPRRSPMAASPRPGRTGRRTSRSTSAAARRTRWRKAGPAERWGRSAARCSPCRPPPACCGWTCRPPPRRNCASAARSRRSPRTAASPRWKRIGRPGWAWWRSAPPPASPTRCVRWTRPRHSGSPASARGGFRA